MCFGVSQLHILLFSSLKQKYPNPLSSEEAWVPPSVVSKETSSVPSSGMGASVPHRHICVTALHAPASCSGTACRAELLHCTEPALVLLRCELWCECMSWGIRVSVSRVQFGAGFFPKSQGSWWDWVPGK